MPELPEVEFARRGLERWTKGRTIERVHVADTRALDRGWTPRKLSSALEGATVVDVARRGKWLRLTLDSGLLIFSHLGMTGKWMERAVDAPPEPFEKLRFDLLSPRGPRRKTGAATTIRYRDPRLFGRFTVAPKEIAEWRALGPDPLVDGVDADRFAETLAKRRLSIKQVLLDQKVLAGVGNILATEALFIARIHPERPANELSAKEAKGLARAVVRSIERTLAREAGPEITYVEEPHAPNPFVIYGHAGEPCPRCKTPLERIVQGGRGTVFCKVCQR